MADPKLTVLLGPGFAPGLAGLGVLQSLKERNVPIQAVVGVNTGALAAALWAVGADLALAARVIARLPWHRLAAARDLAIADPLLSALNVLTRHALFEALPDKLAVVATDGKTGEAVWITRGSVARAIRASMAVAGLFHPLDLDGRRLLDGGRAWPLDCERLPGDRLLTVEIRLDDAVHADPAGGFVIAAQELAARAARQWGQSRSAASERLVVAGNAGGLLDFHKAEEWFAAGREAFEAWLSPGAPDTAP